MNGFAKCAKIKLMLKRIFYLSKILCLCLSRFQKVDDDYQKKEKYIDLPLNNLSVNKYIIENNKLNFCM